MAFTLTFPTTGRLPSAEQIAEWLTEQGEAFEIEAPGNFALKAMPVRIVVGADRLQAWIEVTTEAPLVRMVDVLFELSVLAGADVRLAGFGEMTRPRLWLLLADEQDRQRIAGALDRAGGRGIKDDVVQKLWMCLAAFEPGRDVRWDAANARIVEMSEVVEGATSAVGTIAVDDASFLVEGARPGDVVPVPVRGYLHVLAWRWLSEAWPGLAES